MSAIEKNNTTHKDLVVGLGATGLSIARYLRRVGIDAVFVDSRDNPPGIDELRACWPDAEVCLGALRLPDNVDRIIVSPGVADNEKILKKARKARIEIVSDIELFAREAKAPFAAVTGSNGKSTVTTLLYHMGRAAGKATLAGGNLGEPALDLLDQPQPDLYVLELSSFQLQRTQSLPAAVAVLLNVSPDHLDWHASEREYRNAKYRVYRDAKAAVVNRADKRAIKETRRFERLISFGLDAPADGQYGLRQDAGITYLARGDTLLIATTDIAMYGRHNHANALAALAAGELLGFEATAMLQVLGEFPGLPHRMQFVARKGSVNYINDSKATNVAAAVASVESVDGMIVLLAGGLGKGGDFSELAAALDNKLRAAVLFGTDADKIAAALDTVMPVYFAIDMADAVQQAAAFAETDDTVLLAPACASFDQFANYGARGDAFRVAVEALPR
ncbi:MAG: UDP-N-acetylmuramoyl-L-alanine--D-glutamate ligase [Gammaproteobacteria bacterium]|nr:UDP-N-acetylmuramoyl-L-alanine--D-glutamate ligase [Gammaproteobacteria bacterium]MDH5303451.1 UDP-N-acetylmuramoyl-L-alanine--D-glutamate ligase [Gammaproteobacteria bacterium]MDH5321812.1 UDP-N-acetylmuramoyl-L-alanine--D-glutamate ligase [Gammaproteobacteria bacterium]